MRDYADELLVMAAMWREPRNKRTQIPTCTRRCQQPADARQVCPVLCARWELVDGRLTLIWSEVQEEPLRCAA
jgi:hypothetical protein